MTTPINDDDLSAFLHGELDPHRAKQVEQALAADPALAMRLEAIAEDRRKIAALFAPPDAHEQTEDPDRRRSAIDSLPWRPQLPRALPVWVVLAGCFVIVLINVLFSLAPRRDALMNEALRASEAILYSPVQTQPSLPVIAGKTIHAPDLHRFGLTLAATRSNASENSATFLYRSASGETITLFVRPSLPGAQLALTERGGLRVCIWQDGLISAVLAGQMDAGPLMRVAATAFSALAD